MTIKLKIPTKEEAQKMYEKIQVTPYQVRNLPQNIFETSIIRVLGSSEKLKISPFVKIFRKGNKIALFHTLLMKKAYGNIELEEYLKNIENGKTRDISIKKQLLENGFLVEKSFSKENFYNDFRIRLLEQQPSIGLMYIIVTDSCNFRCKYCFIKEAEEKKHLEYGHMSYETAREGVEFFINQIIRQGNKRIIFYGGEPLLNYEVIKDIIEYIRERERQNAFKGPVNIQMVTNGSLITKKMTDFFAKMRVNISVSIDGPKEIHDKMRVYRKVGGTFKDSLRGFYLLKDAGLDPGISCTICKHNVNRLAEIVEYFAKELKIKGLGFNLPNLIPGQENLDVPNEVITKNIIKAYEKCRKYGIIEDRVFNRRILPFVEERFWLTDCAGCGNQIVLLPNGAIGPCHAFLAYKKYFPSNCFFRENLVRNPVWIEWKKRAPLNMDKCRDCAAISICGGGCAYNAHENKGSIWDLDERICYFCNKVLEWMIWDLYKKLKISN